MLLDINTRFPDPDISDIYLYLRNLNPHPFKYPRLKKVPLSGAASVRTGKIYRKYPWEICFILFCDSRAQVSFHRYQMQQHIKIYNPNLLKTIGNIIIIGKVW